MKISREIEKKLTSQWFAFLQEKIVEEFQNLESEFSIKNKTKVMYYYQLEKSVTTTYRWCIGAKVPDKPELLGVIRSRGGRFRFHVWLVVTLFQRS